jgi:TniQ
VSNPPLPYTPAPFPGELLSSWLKRIATDYRISLPHLAQHLGLSAVNAGMIDSHLKEADIRRIAASTRSDPADIRRMLRRPLRHPAKNLVASQAPIQFCPMCRAVHASTTIEPVAIKAWFEFWRIECLHCRIPFTSVATPNLLRRCNPAREYPEWFSQILPIARIGGQRLAAFARRPLGIPLSPTAVLNLLSMRLNMRMTAADYRAAPDTVSWGNYHCVAELFVPGRAKLLSDEHLVPEIWTDRKPVRLVTARTILFAAMAAFFADVRLGFRRITDRASATMMVVVDRWFDELPSVSRELLATPNRGGSVVSELLQS